ncbi:MAG: OBG GTPase family GTP-binding protein [Candidatus Woesearchaeota archaeon]
MASLEELKALKEELSKTKYNKRTEHAIGLLKAKIARTKKELEKAKSSGEKFGFSIKKTGDAAAVLLGFPSVGKSTLLNKITNANSKVGDYDFTTLNCVPGILEYNNAKIQIIDIPGIISGASYGAGRGREVLSIIRSCDLIIVLIDSKKLEQLNTILKELKEAGIVVNKKKPDIKITKKPYGGISIASTVPLSINKKTIEEVLKELKVINADVLIRENIDVEDIIDAVYANRVYLPMIVVINKSDLLSQEELNSEQFKEFIKKNDALLISAEKKINLDVLKNKIFEKTNLIRVYLKKQGQKPDLNEPIILKNNSNIRELCLKIHSGFIQRFRFARIWGSAKFPGQKVGLDYVLKDKDIVQLHLK